LKLHDFGVRPLICFGALPEKLERYRSSFCYLLPRNSNQIWSNPMEKLIGLLGILTLFAVAFGLSNNRRQIPWRMVGTLLFVEVILALVILKIPGTSDFFFMVGKGINKLLDFANDGAVFALGKTLVFGEFLKPGSPGQHEFIFAIRIGFSIIFISGLASLGYYFGILPRLIKFMARFLVKLGLSGPEALSCSAAAFVGQVECQLLINPYMKTLTRSELFTSMTAAMATISGSALVAYTSIGMPATPLIAASLMSAIGGIILSKIICPETEQHKLQKMVDLNLPHEGVNAFDAAAHGVTAGTEIAMKVVAMVAFAIGFMARSTGRLESVCRFSVSMPRFKTLSLTRSCPSPG